MLLVQQYNFGGEQREMSNMKLPPPLLRDLFIPLSMHLIDYVFKMMAVIPPHMNLIVVTKSSSSIP